uniref:phage head closure protein n=1 Tax=Shewanella sp. TaxID=50422 RepID=UPI00404814CF
MINFGRYNSIIEFYKKEQTKDEFNDTQETLVLYTKKRSRVLNKSTTVTQDNTPSTVEVIEAKIRYQSDITNDLILRFKGVDYEIKSVVDYDHTRKELTITATKV